MNVDYTTALQLLKESIQSNRNYEEFFRTQSSIAEVVANSSKGFLSVSQAANEAINEVMPRQIDFVESLSISAQEQHALNKILDTQMQVMIAAQNCSINSVIKNLLDSFQHYSWQAGLKTYLDSISYGYSAATDVALLKNVRGLEDLTEDGYSPTIKSLLNKMQKKTGERLSLNNQIEVCIQEQIFRPSYSIDSVADVECINVVTSSTDLFSDIPEDKLLIFIDELSNYPELATEDPVGKEIWDIIKNWNAFIGFDRDYYYHARPKKNNDCFYTIGEMKKAPYEFVTSGRFNHMMQSHYYFSDTQDGAEKEVRKHNPKANIQTVRLRPCKKIRMIDLSEKIKHQNLFLQYLRFTVTPGDIKKKDYLLPEFVTTCCKKASIEGIKYYGSKNYKNYVTWDDNYFDIDLLW